MFRSLKLRRSLKTTRKHACWLLGLGLSAAMGCASLTCHDGEEGGCGASISLLCRTSDCDDCPQNAKVCDHPTMMAMARDLDWLKQHIDSRGTIIAKQADVWGQNRLMKHRVDFERMMAEDLTKFTETIQGSVQRSDQAYFANAMALSAAISGNPATLGQPGIIGYNSVSSTKTTPGQPGLPAPVGGSTLIDLVGDNFKEPVNENVAEAIRNLKIPMKTDPISTPSTSKVPVRGTALTPDKVDDPAKLLDEKDVIKRDAKKMEFSFFGQKEGIRLEPTIYLEQKARYLNYLNEIRRINEGDDQADAPGYSLNLVRIPVSILPGTHTRKGHGAEMTFTITPHIGDDLLAMTFQNLIVNDLMDHIGIPIAAFLNNEELVKTAMFGEDEILELLELIECKKTISATSDPCERPASDNTEPNRSQSTKSAQEVRQDTLKQKFGPKFKALSDKLKRLGSGRLPNSKSRRADFAFPISQAYEVYGELYVYRIARNINESLQNSKPNLKYKHLTDIQSILQEELSSAYCLLREPRSAKLWQCINLKQLATAIHTHRADEILCIRRQFYQEFHNLSGMSNRSIDGVIESQAWTMTAALTWAILCEAAVLNEHLVEDMKRTANIRPGCCLPQQWMPYYLPNPPAEAITAFREYIKCRWPIRVFALDPITQDQNIADAFSRRREMQLAMSLAFVSGKISGRNMTKYTRRLEEDIQTLAINRTQVGFSHGNETFGWRFYPRVQTPGFDTNLTVLARDMFIGGPTKDQEIRQWELEPGMRECVALVAMPGFVPYVTIDSTGDWFPLAPHKLGRAIAPHKYVESDHRRAMIFSQKVKTLQNCAQQIMDDNCYRDGEKQRLLRRVDQLSAALPMQTQHTQVPHENTLGGFEMFNSGISDLAPELKGWYGAPGVNRDATTTLFLIGDHFSVHQTRVIAGGLDIKSTELLSRQVVKVDIPANANVIEAPEGKFVDIHLATPYGVTSHMLVPVVAKKEEEPKPKEGFLLKTDKLEINYLLKKSDVCNEKPGEQGKFTLCLEKKNEKDTKPIPAVVSPKELRLGWDDASGMVASEYKIYFVFEINKSILTVPFDLSMSKTTKGNVGEFKIGNEVLTQLATDVLAYLNASSGGFVPGTDPAAVGLTLTTSKIILEPQDDKHTTQPILVGNKLTISFKGEVAGLQKTLCPKLAADCNPKQATPPASTLTPAPIKVDQKSESPPTPK